MGGGLREAFRRSSGELANTFRVRRSSIGASGSAIRDNVPRELGLHCKYRHHLDVSGTTSLLGLEPAPLPFATISVRERGRKRTAVGYQPVGRNPSACERPGWFTSNTATWLAPAFATYSRSPFASSVSPLGMSPTGSSGVRDVRSISIVRPAATSTTATLLTFELATNTREPSRDSTRSVGWSPTGITRVISSDVASTMARLAELHRETKM